MERLERSNRGALPLLLTWNLVVALLLRFVVMLYPNLHLLQSHLFGLLPVMLVFPMLRLPAVHKQTGMRLCACLAVWIAFVCLFPAYVESDLYTVLTSFFLTLVFLFVTCYPMAFVMGREGMRRAFHVMTATFVFPMTAVCAVGIYTALRGVSIPSLAGGSYMACCIVDHRLSMFVSSVATGSYACMAVFLGVLRLMDRPRPIVSVLYALCIPIAYVAAALSDARIPIVCSSICIGGLAWLIATGRLPVKRRVTRIGAAFCIAGAVVLALYFGTGLCIRGTNAASAVIAARGGSSFGQEPAGETQPDGAPASEGQPAGTAQPAENEMAQRPLLYRIGTLNGRTDVWESAIEMFRHEPHKLLIGTSPVFIIRDTQPYLSPDALNPVYPHMHSLPFQTVTALGLPGLLLYAVLIVYICTHALRVFFLGAGRLSPFERGVALIPLFYAVMDVADVSLWFAPPSSFTPLLFYVAGGYAVYLSITYIPKKGKATGLAADRGKGANA